MRYSLIALTLLLSPLGAAQAQISVGIGVALPGVSIGINMPAYPRLVRVPGYPVYYDPNADANYFFYDGLYWVLRDDGWYQSTWYNGPWLYEPPESVPLFVLRVPVRYYRRPPGYFQGWRADAPPRWDTHFGPGWAQQRRGWDRWDRRAVPAPAPLPVYQRQYSGERYPQQLDQQRTIQAQRYRYQPHDVTAPQREQQREHLRNQPAPSQPQLPGDRPNILSPQRNEAPGQRAPMSQPNRGREGYAPPAANPHGDGPAGAAQRRDNRQDPGPDGQRGDPRDDRRGGRPGDGPN